MLRVGRQIRSLVAAAKFCALFPVSSVCLGSVLSCSDIGFHRMTGTPFPFPTMTATPITPWHLSYQLNLDHFFSFFFFFSHAR
jgi:hypothetical protein